MLRSKTFRVSIFAFCLSLIWGLSTPSALAEDPLVLWQAPESGHFLLSPSAGYSEGDELTGATISLRGIFAFKYIIGGVHGQAIFIPSGVLYSMSVDLIGRYGPFYAGIAATGHWFPSDSNVPKPGVAFQVGMHIPSGFDGIFFDLGYRPNVVFLSSRQMVFHTVLLGLVFETGD